MKSLYDRLKEIPDPRNHRKKKHDVAEMLAYIIMGCLCGKTAIRRSLSWAVSNEKLLRKYMKLKGGIASASTIRRLLSTIDEEIFTLTFSDWITQLLHNYGLHIIIDGKALRASTEKITAKGADFLFQVKKNQPRMYADIMDFFGNLEEEQDKAKNNLSGHPASQEPIARTDHYETDEKNRERYEHREYMSCQDTECLSDHSKMPYIKTVGSVLQVRRMIIKDNNGNDITPNLKNFLKEGSTKQPKVQNGDGITDAVQKTGIVSSRILTAAEIGRIKRDHWRIENGLHHVLDDV